MQAWWQRPAVVLRAHSTTPQPVCDAHSTLNRIQSRIFTAAFTSNHNLLVCAPTGAGKTNIAMVAVLREVGSHTSPQDGSIDKAAFKVVYVAPMKALAAEVTAAFARRLAPLGTGAPLILFSGRAGCRWQLCQMMMTATGVRSCQCNV